MGQSITSSVCANREKHAPRLQIRAQNLTLAEDQVPGLPAGAYVEFEVRDNGAGIKPEHVEKIFDPFFTTKKHGTGLGLFVTRKLVTDHGGTVTFESKAGDGTVFWVELPCLELAPDQGTQGEELQIENCKLRIAN